MNVSSRVKEIRKVKNLSQAAFGKFLGVSRDVINNIENNRVELSEVMLKALCSEFAVSEKWLRTGEGQMFIEDENALITQLSKQYNLDAFSRKFIETYISLPESHRNVIKSFARSLAEVAAAEDFSVELVPANTSSCAPLTDAEIEAEVDSYRRELEAEKRATERSSVLPDTKKA